jgi:hypothetical protein
MAHLVINSRCHIVNVEGCARLGGRDIGMKKKLIQHIAKLFPQISAIPRFDGLY